MFQWLVLKEEQRKYFSRNQVLSLFCPLCYMEEQQSVRVAREKGCLGYSISTKENMLKVSFSFSISAVQFGKEYAYLTSIFFKTSRLLLWLHLFAFFGLPPAEIKYITIRAFSMWKNISLPFLLALQNLYLQVCGGNFMLFVLKYLLL